MRNVLSLSCIKKNIKGKEIFSDADGFKNVIPILDAILLLTYAIILFVVSGAIKGFALLLFVILTSLLRYFCNRLFNGIGIRRKE